MGVSFVQSLVNLFMGLWEKRYIWANNPFAKHLVLYGRYIDDVIIIRQGTRDEVKDFLKYRNNNEFWIKFTHVCDPDVLVFLDLELRHENTRIVTKNHFKPTSGNSYLHQNSCHVPNGREISRSVSSADWNANCTNVSDYSEQGAILSRKLKDKGYKERSIEEAFQKYLRDYDDKIHMEGCDVAMKAQKPAANEEKGPCFIASYNREHDTIRKIILKNWNILQRNPLLSPMQNRKPQIIFRKARAVRNFIAPSKIPFNIPTKNRFFPLAKRCFRCSKPRCKSCDHILRKKTSFQNAQNKEYNISEFITCATTYVVYALICPCDKSYVGRTMRSLWERFDENRRSIKKSSSSLSVANHFRSEHSGAISKLKVFGIENISDLVQEGKRFKILCREIWKFVWTKLLKTQRQYIKN